MALNKSLSLNFGFPVLFAALAMLCCDRSSVGQTLIDVDFDNRGASTYTEDQVEEDFGELRFTNGVDEGWVQIVTGNDAFGGTGSSIRCRYPEGGVGPGEGGAQWIVELDEGYEEAYLSYRVKFAEGFDFVRGGKLPGLAGGSAPSGSAPADGVRGWSGRLMWRTAFQGETGQPEQRTSGLISYAKHRHSGFAMDGRQEDEVFVLESDGDQSVLRADRWYTIRQRVVMNTPGQRDGIFQIWLDGRLVHDQHDLQWRDVPGLQIDRLFFSTFFGGGEAWRTSKEEFTFFDDIKMSVPRERRVPEDYGSPEAAVAAANPGDTVLLGSANWYANLLVNEPITISGRGNCRLMAARGNQPIIQVRSDGASIQNLTISRGIVGVEGLPQSSRLSISDCQFRDIFGDGIRCSGNREIAIIDTSVHDNEGRGVFLNQVEGFFISNCVASRNGGAGFEIFSDNGFVTDCRSNNNGAGAGFYFIGSDLGLVNNVSASNTGMGFLFVNSENIGFTNNSASSNSRFGLLNYAVSDGFFADNRIIGNDAVGVIFNNSRRNTFQSNFMCKNTGIGVFFSASTSDNVVTQNSYLSNAFNLGRTVDAGDNFIDE